MRIQADVLFDEGDLKLFGPAVYDVLIVPGGAKGAETISQSAQVQQLVREYLESNKYVGMICAGSLTALTAKLPTQPLTSHPSVQNQLDKGKSLPFGNSN
ncbi:hypothetical protein DL96DRAFT_1596823 [Flagelloscypha sp. PMI_526]|nr:hypothetical protein DL96DRAFT_1596823 [Flagelloscypha sp. PMI_526]